MHWKSLVPYFVHGLLLHKNIVQNQVQSSSFEAFFSISVCFVSFINLGMTIFNVYLSKFLSCFIPTYLFDNYFWHAGTPTLANFNMTNPYTKYQVTFCSPVIALQKVGNDIVGVNILINTTIDKVADAGDLATS